MTHGKMISLEGVEGAGKSTQLTMLVDYLKQQGIAVIATREPGGTGLGEKIRSILLVDDDTSISLESELLLLFAARAQHMEEVIRPALENGHWVVCDRFTDASCAYQSGGRGMNNERIQQLEQWLLSGFKPNLSILLDISVSAGFQRIAKRGKDRFEQEEKAFFERVRLTYLQREKSDQSRIKLIDAGLSSDQVANQIQLCLDTLIARL